AEMVGRVGIELFLMDKKDLAKQVLDKGATGVQPAMTALWLGLNPDKGEPENTPHVSPPSEKGKLGVTREARLAYAEGFALQGKFADALKVADLQGANSNDRLEALALIAAAALAMNKLDDAGPLLESIPGIIKNEMKGPPPSAWLLARIAELATIAKKTELAATMLESIKDDEVRAWAKLDMIRVKLAAQTKQKADDSLLDALAEPKNAPLAAGLARAEIARHQAALGDSAYQRSVEIMAKGMIRPFGYAGTALGTQDRKMK
ncbi:MAG: hypothetical protein K8T89_19735, partial [Planctomycetes bacterium]|nr:hypothetical protein [Planctomycetota bacterium]